MKNRSKILYDFNMDEWIEGMDKEILPFILILLIGAFANALLNYKLIQLYGIQNIQSIVTLAVVCLLVFGTISSQLACNGGAMNSCRFWRVFLSIYTKLNEGYNP